MPLEDVHVLIPGTCEYITLCDKRNLTDVIRLNILRCRDYTEFSGWVHCNHKGSPKRALGETVRESDVIMKADI